MFCGFDAFCDDIEGFWWFSGGFGGFRAVVHGDWAVGGNLWAVACGDWAVEADFWAVVR